jgi:hypothetical protein
MKIHQHRMNEAQDPLMVAARSAIPDFKVTRCLADADVIVVTKESEIGDVLRDGAFIAVMEPDKKLPWPGNVVFTDTKERIECFVNYLKETFEQSFAT